VSLGYLLAWQVTAANALARRKWNA
jgi:hypothetical protein